MGLSVFMSVSVLCVAGCVWHEGMCAPMFWVASHGHGNFRSQEALSLGHEVSS